MPKNFRRTTLRDIAQAAGCHYSTVSLALRNHPGLPKETIERLQALAQSMGYVPDPMLASLASYRTALGAVGFHATLGWVTNHSTRNGWRNTKIFADYFAGAEQRARSLGYALEEFWLGERGMTPARAVQILRARGIVGLIVSPLPAPSTTIDLDWANFSAVAIGYSLTRPHLHVVCPNQYRAVRHAMEEVARRGYRRPGLAMLRASDERVECNWTAGYSTSQRLLPAPDRVPALLLETWDEAEFDAWRKRHKPDVILTKFGEISPLLLRKGASKVHTGVVQLSLPEAQGEIAGLYENPARVGAAAVEYLTSMVQRSECGVPQTPQQLLVEATWVDGRSLR